jgi:hypothetical protein
MAPERHGIVGPSGTLLHRHQAGCVSEAAWKAPPVNKNTLIRNTFVLPCCILLLNLCVGLVSYKAKLIEDPLLQTAAVIGMVLVGGSLVGLVMGPAIDALVGMLHRVSRQRLGGLGEIGFLLLLGIVVYWLYYRMYILGPAYVLPPGWRNPGR